MSGFLTAERITGATVFVDHVTQYTYVHLMKGLTTELTLEAKAACERVFSQFGHKIRHYRADNGRFADNKFITAVHTSNQKISFCGVGAHHQNAIAERGIKELTLIGRTLLLHAQRHWPEYISSILWPLALKTASDRMNILSINDSLESPLSKISEAENNINVNNFHTWGCPVYVLEANLQSGGIVHPKWDPRSRLGIYVGRSPFHAGNVALVLNPQTGYISPQYHLVFDDNFSTISNLRSGTTPSDWITLVCTSSEKVTDEAYRLSDTWFSSDSKSLIDDNSSERGSDKISHMPSIVNLPASGLRRSTRTKKAATQFGFFTKFCLLSAAALTIHKYNNPSSFISRIMNQLEKVNMNFD